MILNIFYIPAVNGDSDRELCARKSKTYVLMFKVRCVLFTIFSLQQLVDDVAEVLHFRASRDGEWDIIYNIPEKKRKVCLLFATSYPHHIHTYI